MIDYRNMIIEAAMILDHDEDWGLDLTLFWDHIPKINEILNESGIENRSTEEWDKLINEAFYIHEDGELAMNLQIAQKVLEM